MNNTTTKGTSIKGTFQGFKWRSEDRSFGIGTLDMKDAGKVSHVTVTGPIIAETGDQIICTGYWDDNPRYGRQFKVKSMERGEITSDATGIIGFLQQLPGIGPSKGEAIYMAFKEKTFDVIENDHKLLAQVPGVSVTMAEGVRDAYLAKVKERDMIVFLKKFGITDGKIAKIIGFYGPTLRRVLKNNPFQMITDIDGFGFKTVDQIALAAGLPRDSEYRIDAGVKYLLNEEASGNGNTIVEEQAFFREALKLLQLPAPAVAEVIKAMVADGRLVRSRLEEDKWGLAHAKMFGVESSIANKIKNFLIEGEVDAGIAAEDDAEEERRQPWEEF